MRNSLKERILGERLGSGNKYVVSNDLPFAKNSKDKHNQRTGEIKMKIALAVVCLLVSPAVFAQAPTGLVATEIVSTAPTLGGYFQWNAVSGGTYNLYQASDSECKSANPTRTKVASGLSATDYTISSLAFGEYCYWVTAVVSGVESGYSNAIPLNIGNKWYGTVKFNTTPVTFCNGCVWTLTDKDSNTQVFQVSTNAGGNSVFTFFADCGNYELVMKLPSGKLIIDDTEPFACAGYNISGIGSTTHTVIYDQGLGLAAPYVVSYITQNGGGSPTK